MIKNYIFLVTFLFIQSFATAQHLSVGVSPQTICKPGDCTTIGATYSQLKETTSYQVTSISPNSSYSTNPPFATNLVTDDNWSQVIDLNHGSGAPFNFCFFGNTYSKCLINTNGVISFSIAGQVPGGVYNPGGGAGFTLSQPIPFNPGTTSAPYLNAIHGVFQDTYPTFGTNINYYVDGVYPNRAFVLSMIDVPNYSCSTVLQSSQIILYEGSNIIDVYVYKRNNSCAWQGGRAVLGIQNNTGTVGVTPTGRNTGSWAVPASAPEAWRFTPNGNVITPNIIWTDSQGTVVGNLAMANLCPLSTTTYTATVQYPACNSNLIEVSNSGNVFVETIPAGQPSDLVVCTNSSSATFDLTTNTAPVMANLNPIQYSISYHTTLLSAQGSSSNLISAGNLNSFVSSGQPIFIRIDDFFSPNACAAVKSFNLVLNAIPNAPTGAINQVFVNGETLADVELVGNGIQWYGSSTGNDLLPMSTVLTDGTTYYASQTSSSCESPSRLAVTMSLIVLGNQDFVEANLKVYPNPVSNILNLSYNTEISSVTIYNLLGQEVFSKTLNANQAKLDLSSFASGSYIVKVKAFDNIKTFKIVKK